MVERLHGLCVALQSTRAVLARIHHDQASFKLVAAAGGPLLAAGTDLPLSASSIMLAASQGRRAKISTETTWRPLEQLAASAGIRSALGIPLDVAGAVIGAVAVLWRTPQPRVTNRRALAVGDEPELVDAALHCEHANRRVLLCHEEQLTANGLARVLEQDLSATVILANTIDGALGALANDPPDLIACSDCLAPGVSLRALARHFRAAGAAAPLLVLVRTDSRHTFETVLDAGASGYLTMARAAVNLSATAAKLLAGKSVLPTRPPTRPEPHLTDRERDVLICFDRGLSDKEVARALGVALSTVKTHARAIYGKLGVPSRTAALHHARLAGLL